MPLPPISFEDYLGYVNLVELKKGIRTTSSVSLTFALDYYRNQVNQADSEVNQGVTDPSSTFDVRAEMVDRRTTDEATALREGWGNTYQIFSNSYVAKYNMSSWWALKLDMFSIIELLNKDFGSGGSGGITELPYGILLGESGSVIVDASHGQKVVTISNADEREYSVMLSFAEAEAVEGKVDKLSFSEFKISLYDFDYFEETPYDGSVKPMPVSYVVVFNDDEGDI